MRKSTKIVALDQHMVDYCGRGRGRGRAGAQAPELYGDIPNTPEAVAKLARRLSRRSTQLRRAPKDVPYQTFG